MPISNAHFGYVRDLVHRRSAIRLEDCKSYLVESRLSGIARQEGLDNVDALIERLRASGLSGLEAKVVDALTTNETSFLRDLHPFHALRDTILPALVQARTGAKPLRVWCAACSSGQEPYSLAMILRETFPDLRAGDVEILASDLCESVLDRAREGTFSQFEVNRGLPASYLKKYFVRAGSRWQIREDLRSGIRFERVNLIEDWPRSMSGFDLVFVRNVLIYFDVEAKRRVLERMKGVLQPEGYLLLGSTETMLGLESSFRREAAGRAVVYRPES